jgi:hypothetical protein
MGVAAVQNPDLSHLGYGFAVPGVRTPESHGKFRETGEGFSFSRFAFRF